MCSWCTACPVGMAARLMLAIAIGEAPSLSGASPMPWDLWSARTSNSSSSSAASSSQRSRSSADLLFASPPTSMMALLDSPDPSCALHLDRLPPSVVTLRLPVFTEEAQLQRSPWRHYVHKVYGRDAILPLDMRCLIFFWEDLLPASAANLFKSLVYNESASPAEPFKNLRNGDILRTSGGFFVYLYHNLTWPDWSLTFNPTEEILPPSLGPFNVGKFLSHSRVEILHNYDDCLWQGPYAGKDVGYWGHYAPGTGVFADLGRTITTGEGGYGTLCATLLGLDQCGGCCAQLHVKEVIAARRAGYDSLQSCCGTRGTTKFESFFEIQFLRSDCSLQGHHHLHHACPAFLSSGRIEPRNCSCTNASLPRTRCLY